MRILLLGAKEYPFGSGSDLSGGMESYVQQLAEKLAGKNEVTLITRKFKCQSAEEKKGKLKIIRVGWLNGTLLRNPSFNVSAFLKARQIAFDVVHAHGFVATFFGSMLGRPLVATPHGVAAGQPQYGALNSLLRHLERKAYERAASVVFLSENEKEKFSEKLGFTPKNSKVIPTGIDIAKYAKAKPAHDLKLKKPVVTFIGRLIEVKGLKYLLEAMPGVNATLLIVGDGPQRKELEEKAGANVVFAGWRKDVAEVLAASDVFVLPSLSEGLPVALLEAFASGKPCIVTDIGLPVTDGKTALVVKPKNAAALAKALNKVLADKSLAARLAKNAKAEAKKYDWGNVVREHEKLYNLLL